MCRVHGVPDHTPSPGHKANIEAVLFDMGGVLIQLDALENVLGPSSLTSEEIWNGWILSDAVQAFERGLCSVEDFAASIVDELELVGTAEEFVERFVKFPQGLYPGAVEMVASVPDGIVTGVLSNTSALHWDHQIDAETVRGLCDRAYLSFAMGLAKPERHIFDAAVADLNIAADRVLFIDDNQINVDGAIAAGLQSALAKGPAQAAAALQAFDIT